MSRRNRRQLSIHPDSGKKVVLLGYLLVMLGMLLVSLWPACWLVVMLQPYATTSLRWSALILLAVLVFNYAYAIALLGLRLIIPYTKPGFYARGKDGRPPREAAVFMLNVLLTKLRYQTPWAGMFTGVLTSLFPLQGLYQRHFGPHTPSIGMGDVALFLDPYLVTAGKNVQFGFHCLLACHLFDHRGLMVKGIEIGDDVIIGGECLIMPGVKIGQGAVIAAQASVRPGTVIGPYEYWAGNPAQKVKDLRRSSSGVIEDISPSEIMAETVETPLASSRTTVEVACPAEAVHEACP